MTDRLRLGMGGVLVLVLAASLWLAVPRHQPEPTRDVAAALEAWARFASTGDLHHLAGHFVADGPQYRQLAEEAGQDRNWDGRDYRFQLDQGRVVGDDLVTGTVTVTRDGLVTMTSRWEVELRLVDGRWQIWTVRTVGPSAS